MSSSISNSHRHPGLSTKNHGFPPPPVRSIDLLTPARPKLSAPLPSMRRGNRKAILSSAKNNNLTLLSSASASSSRSKPALAQKELHEETASIDENSNRNIMNSKRFHSRSSRPLKARSMIPMEEAVRNFSTNQSRVPLDEKKPARVSGEGALSTQSYKDAALRQAVHAYVQATNTLQNMLQFQDKPLNQHMPTGNAMSVIYDPIIEHPQLPGLWDYQRRRNQPLRMAVAESREVFDAWLDDLVAHRDEVLVTSNPRDMDKRIFGERPQDLDELLESFGTESKGRS